MVPATVFVLEGIEADFVASLLKTLTTALWQLAIGAKFTSSIETPLDFLNL